MTDAKKLVGARIKALRQRAGKTQEALAELVELDARHLSRLEVGRHFPALDSLVRIAAALDVPLVEFFTFPEEESLESQRRYLTAFTKKGSPNQVRLAVKTIKLVVNP